jgi:hypothetical protein
MGIAVATILVVASGPPPRTGAGAVPSASRSPASTPGPSSTGPAASGGAPSPSATPVAIYEDLSGVPTTEDLAHRYPIAVMLDDSPAARPQSGLSHASVVWQAPVEGGIPRYMAVFQAGTAPEIGPVRSARLYFVRWAAEWRAVYNHVGGPAPLRAFLRGGQQLVIDADGKKSYRVPFRAAPHNVYTTGRRLLDFSEENGATADNLPYDPAKPGALQPFRDGAAEADRGRDGSVIRVRYTSEQVAYDYDLASNTWLRSVDGKPQHDAEDRDTRGGGSPTDGPRIAPTTVIVMHVNIRISNNVNGPTLGRVAADSIGSGKAWIFADGHVTVGFWRKASPEARTVFLDAARQEVVLPRGQIFVQVIPGPGSFEHDVAAKPATPPTPTPTP